MREIKFRAYHPQTKAFRDVKMIDFERRLIRLAGYTFNLSLDEVNLVEYTGLHDNKRTKEYPNGQEIYEGDIVRTIGQFVDYETFEVTQYFGGAWGLKDGEEYLSNLISTSALRYTTDGGLPIYTEIEVIGNIYENKELLK